MNVILTAGRASRLDGIAPYGCKALTPLDGRPMVEHQLDVFGDATIVCLSVHVPLLKKYGPCIVNDRCAGPADALRSVFTTAIKEPVTVAYADSYFTSLPDGTNWVGANTVEGGRNWDLVFSDGHVAYQYLPEGETGKACVGLYSFGDPYRLALRLEWLSAYFQRKTELQMGPVINNYPGLSYVEIPSWQDVGTPETLAAWKAAA